MAIREVLRYPDPALKQPSRPLGVTETELIGRLAEDLVETMRAHAGCVGLAAPQLGELVRIVVVDVADHRRAISSNGLLVLVNPRIVYASGSEIAREGCLSIPELTANVRRATDITVTASIPGGAPTSVDSSGFEARCLQHELDHLDGVLFLDRVASLTTDVFRRTRSAP